MARLRDEQNMARAYGDDLRRKFLEAYDQGEASLVQLAEVFRVSPGWAKKISAQRRRSGQMERVAHKPGRKPRVGEPVRQQVKTWFDLKPDLTLAEVQGKLHREAGIQLSLPQIWHLLRKLNLRLKKSHSTPPSATRKPTVNAARSSSSTSARSRRNT
jgi:transposase